MKGIILAGGSGTRLYPLTMAVSKQLLPVYDKPMIYYPLSTLMAGDIRDILIISTPNDISMFKRLLRDGSQFGINIQYAMQPSPRGIAEAFLIGESFIGWNNVTLILGDNIFHTPSLNLKDNDSKLKNGFAVNYAYQVKDPERYGVVSFDSDCKPKTIEEKPKNPASNFAVTGLYSYNCDVISIARHLKPSARGELEITDINRRYLESGNLEVNIIPRGSAWLDTGTIDALIEASAYVQAIEHRQGQKIACPEEIAFKKGWISLSELERQAEHLAKTEYGNYLYRMISNL
jgi:glucose-1-phosphate thymidylyltransferase